jgi:isoleucyl-tRNA synthetase
MKVLTGEQVPLQDLVVVHKDQQYLDDVKAFEHYILEELRVEKLTLSTDEDGHGVVYKVKADWPILGKKLKKDMPKVKNALPLVSSAEVKKYLETKSIVVGGISLGEEDLQVSFCAFKADATGYSRRGSGVYISLYCEKRQ